MNQLSVWSRAVARICRWLPAGTRGKWRIARILLSGALGQRDVLLVHEYGCALKVPVLAEPIAFSVLVDGSYEPDVLSALAAQLKQGSVYVDVGANIGVLALPAAILCGAAGRVIAVEASPAMQEYLRFNTSLADLKNISLFRCAATDREGPVQFFEPPARHFGMGSIAPQFGVSAVEVEGRRLDSILADAGVDHVDALKVDVEGFEAQVFAGASELLGSAHAPLILFEFCDWAEDRSGNERGASQGILRDFGYRIWKLKDWNGAASPLSDLIRTGFETLVASKLDRPPGRTEI